MIIFFLVDAQNDVMMFAGVSGGGGGGEGIFDFGGAV
jgi:hypothetical protein